MPALASSPEKQLGIFWKTARRPTSSVVFYVPLFYDQVTKSLKAFTLLADCCRNFCRKDDVHVLRTPELYVE
jgi:hypothetical protein